MFISSETVNKGGSHSNNRTEKEKLIMDYLTIEAEEKGKNYRYKHGAENGDKWKKYPP